MNVKAVPAVPENNLKEIREQEGLAISALSRFAGVSEKTIRYLENLKKDSRKLTKQKIVNGLNKNPNRTKEYTYMEVFVSTP